jgi:hypothetical protein
MCYYLNVQFQGQWVKGCFLYEFAWNTFIRRRIEELKEIDKKCIIVFTYGTPFSSQILKIKTWIFSKDFRKILK